MNVTKGFGLLRVGSSFGKLFIVLQNIHGTVSVAKQLSKSLMKSR